MDLSCFNLIYSLKEIQKCELILDEDDIYCIDNFYKLVKKWVTKKGFIKACKVYQLDAYEPDMYKVCDILTTEIIKKYGRY